MSLTKEQIDALVRALVTDEQGYKKLENWVICEDKLTVALYKAAGLTATGERKPERVRCWIFPDYYPDGRPMLMAAHEGCTAAIPFTPGWFVPDGAE